MLSRARSWSAPRVASNLDPGKKGPCPGPCTLEESTLTLWFHPYNRGTNSHEPRGHARPRPVLSSSKCRTPELPAPQSAQVWPLAPPLVCTPQAAAAWPVNETWLDGLGQPRAMPIAGARGGAGEEISLCRHVPALCPSSPRILIAYCPSRLFSGYIYPRRRLECILVSSLLA